MSQKTALVPALVKMWYECKGPMNKLVINSAFTSFFILSRAQSAPGELQMVA